MHPSDRRAGCRPEASRARYPIVPMASTEPIAVRSPPGSGGSAPRSCPSPPGPPTTRPLVLASTESGSYQLHAWDRRTGARRQVTLDPVGVLEGRPTRDGTGVIWFHDETGDETGTWVVAPLDEAVASEPLLGAAARAGARGWRSAGGGPSPASADPTRLHDLGLRRRRRRSHCSTSTTQPVRLGGGSVAGRPRSRPARCPRTRRGRGARGHGGRRRAPPVAARRSTPRPARPSASSGRGPGAGRVRVLARAGRPAARDHPRARRRRTTGLWHARTRRASPSSRVDLRRRRRARGLVAGRLRARCCCSSSSTAATISTASTSTTGRSSMLDTEPGSITAAAVRPDGSVWYRGHNGEHPARMLAAGCGDARCSRPDGPAAPLGRDVRVVVVRQPTGRASTGSSSGPRATGRTR